MTSNIYIIADGNKTKIGISKKLDSRMSTYDTHNPNYKLMYNYVCSETDAKRIESLIKIVLRFVM